MKKLIYIVLFGIIAVSISSEAQNIVTYDFQTNAFDKTIPFDELITFKFVNIPQNSINAFTFSCVQINKFDEPGVPLFTPPIKISKFTNDSSASIVSDVYFPPNKDIIFEIKLREERELLPM